MIGILAGSMLVVGQPAAAWRPWDEPARGQTVSEIAPPPVAVPTPTAPAAPKTNLSPSPSPPAQPPAQTATAPPSPAVASRAQGPRVSYEVRHGVEDFYVLRGKEMAGNIALKGLTGGIGMANLQHLANETHTAQTALIPIASLPPNQVGAELMSRGLKNPALIAATYAAKEIANVSKGHASDEAVISTGGTLSPSTGAKDGADIVVIIRPANWILMPFVRDASHGYYFFFAQYGIYDARSGKRLAKGVCGHVDPLATSPTFDAWLADGGARIFQASDAIGMECGQKIVASFPAHP
jgi:hypothetical protein